MKTRWNDPEERQCLIIAMRESYTPERSKIISENNKKLWSNSEHKQKRCEAMSKSWTPERRKAQAERMRAMRNKKKTNE